MSVAETLGNAAPVMRRLRWEWFHTCALPMTTVMIDGGACCPPDASDEAPIMQCQGRYPSLTTPDLPLSDAPPTRRREPSFSTRGGEPWVWTGSGPPLRAGCGRP